MPNSFTKKHLSDLVCTAMSSDALNRREFMQGVVRLAKALNSVTMEALELAYQSTEKGSEGRVALLAALPTQGTNESISAEEAEFLKKYIEAETKLRVKSPQEANDIVAGAFAEAAASIEREFQDMEKASAERLRKVTAVLSTGHTQGTNESISAEAAEFLKKCIEADTKLRVKSLQEANDMVAKALAEAAASIEREFQDMEKASAEQLRIVTAVLSTGQLSQMAATPASAGDNGQEIIDLIEN